MPPTSRLLRGRPRACLSLGTCLFLFAACPGGQTATTDDASTGATSSSTGTTTTTDTTAGPTTTTTTDPTTSTSAPPTTTTASTGPAPAECGDGVVADSEICDDGNDDPDDGCNAKCEKTGAVEWTYTHDGAAGKDDGVSGLAVDPTGRIVVVGFETGPTNRRDMLIIVLDPDGSEVWREVFDGAAGEHDAFVDVAVDDAGNIYAGGYEVIMGDIADSVIRAFAPDGAALWTYADPSPAMDFSSIRDVAVTPDALYSVGYDALGDAGGQLVVRRHDLATGEAAWKTPTQEGTMEAVGQAITVVGSDIIAVGNAADSNQTRPLIAVFTDAGDHVSTEIEDHPGGAWFDVAPIGPDGDLVLAGRRVPEGITGFDIAVRRVGPDFAEQWTQLIDHDLLYDTANGVAIGPDEAIFVSGLYVQAGEFDNVFAGRFAPDGTKLWTHTYDNPEIHLYDDGTCAGFGPDFVVVGGTSSVLGQGSNVWVRRLKAD